MGNIAESILTPVTGHFHDRLAEVLGPGMLLPDSAGEAEPWRGFGAGQLPAGKVRPSVFSGPAPRHGGGPSRGGGAPE